MTQETEMSFSSTSSPCAKRDSFLSLAMLNDEKHSVYEVSSYYMYYNEVVESDDEDEASNDADEALNRVKKPQRILSFSLSLKESQGFSFNQDLFASEYQQAQAQKYNKEADDDGGKNLLLDNKFEIVHQKRRKSANNEREGYNCVEVSEIRINDSDDEII